jgi:predicted component of type VI protein secretion system
MPFELSINGPGLQIRRLLGEGQSILIGRDSDSDLCLPDPQKTVSRQHVVVWVESGQLQLRVLSVVNGVDLASGEVAPGGVAALVAGDVLRVGDYNIIVAGQPGVPGGDSLTADILSDVMPASHGVHGDEDPFGEWGFDPPAVDRLTPQPEQLPSGSMRTQQLAAVGVVMTGEVAAFYRGLGLDPARINALSIAELEAAGKKMRIALQGLMELYAAKLDLNREMGSEERTMVATRENNPLKTDWTLDTKIEYLLAGRTAGNSFIQPEQAVAELVADLRIHDKAVAAASRAVLEGALREFDPAKLESRASQEGAGLMARLWPWEAYAKYYAGESSRMAQWVEGLFNRYFTRAYTAETTRIKRSSEHREPAP